MVTGSICRFLKGVVLATGMVCLLGELPLLSFWWPESGQLALGQHAYRTYREKDPKSRFGISSQLRGEASFSEGNKRYWYLELFHRQKQVLSWWGTAALFSEPKV